MKIITEFRIAKIMKFINHIFENKSSKYDFRKVEMFAATETNEKFQMIEYVIG